MLYCVVPSRVEDGKFAGGVYKSADRGESWTSVMGGGINTEITAADPWAQSPICQYQWVLTTNVDPNIVYALNSNTGVHPPHHTAAFRSDNAGRTWRATFYPNRAIRAATWRRASSPRPTASSTSSPPWARRSTPRIRNHLVQVNDWVYYTTNRRPLVELRPCPAGGHNTWLCNGLVVTSTWNYYIDPFQPERHYIAYTNVGFARSLDAGKTWAWWAGKGRTPWRNTCYELAFDPKTPGKI